MFSADQYQLLDFGHGRKLERFGDYTIDRPAPNANGVAMGGASLWRRANARFSRPPRGSGNWQLDDQHPASWSIQHGQIVFELRRSDSGALGVYPEQAENWDWIGRCLQHASRPLKVLNLFGYTGGSTFAAAAAGAEVVHVDASTSAVKWARRSAILSNLEDAPIRWIVEDARKFAERELRRGVQYDAVILDPPTYGHGPRAQAWRIHDDLYRLLTTCGRLTSHHRAFVLLTCHSPELGPAELEAVLADTIFGHCQTGIRAQRLTLRTQDGRRLPSGAVARWPS